ncbi:MAG: site-2 protease family protein [Acidiphilium sp.]|nr:site-2 protease family protein [Acidiphilium sp.]MDD4935816.1 site-2 protease family protein [Acidiphilium sp.]
MNTELIRTIVIGVTASILAIVLHELAHGFTALAMGDHTAQREGRLSLNPLRHVDRFGTVILPAILIVAQLLTIGRIGFMFGWAKPVPIDPSGFRDPRRGMAIVAAAGPASNFLLALISAFALAAIGTRGIIADFLLYFLLFNVLLGLFNLVPLPPFDGGRIAVGLLPLAAAKVLAQVERLGILVILFLVFILPAALGEFGIKFNPVSDLIDNWVPRVAGFFLHLAGVHAGY